MKTPETMTLLECQQWLEYSISIFECEQNTGKAGVMRAVRAWLIHLADENEELGQQLLEANLTIVDSE